LPLNLSFLKTHQQKSPTPGPCSYEHAFKKKWRSVMPQDPRPLTHDEKKAAEAAFKGLPFNPQWSEAGRKVYWGLSAAIANKGHEAFQDMSPSQPTMLARRAVVLSTSRTLNAGPTIHRTIIH
jgi:hypothetical protein